MDFYNTLDIKPICISPFTSADEAERLGCWPAAELPGTVNHDEPGNLGLTATDVDDIVAFLGTLTDGFAADQVAAVEPGTLSLLLMGVLGLGVWRRHR